MSVDWRNPNYFTIWKQRKARLEKLRSDPFALAIARRWYKDHIADFINDWGVTVDPRNAATDRPIIMPFILFPKQREFIDFILTQWKAPDDGVLVKSRDCGASWLAMAVSVSLCAFWRNVTIGFGSAKEEKVDRSGDPDCLFYKGRMFAQYLPREFKGGWTVNKFSAHMRLSFPETESSITGEAGDNIGRGGRKTIYFIDEFAVVERPKLVDANLVANTNCRIEMSTVNGLANVFAERARGGKIKRFDFHYRDDPRKVDQQTGKTYPDFQERLDKMDPVVKAQEYDCDFLASAEGVLIEAEWVQAAIGALQKLKITSTGEALVAYDVADQGADLNATCARKGVEVVSTKQWSGKASDLGKSVFKVYDICDEIKAERLIYDADGGGAHVRSHALRINEERLNRREKPIRHEKFHGSGQVLDPDLKAPGTDRLNKDYFGNQKAQSWMAVRQRFINTFHAVNGRPYDPDNIISIRPGIENLNMLCSELSQPTRTWSLTGKMIVDKTPEGVKSPNLADALMMAFRYGRPSMVFSDELLELI